MDLRIAKFFVLGGAVLFVLGVVCAVRVRMPTVVGQHLGGGGRGLRHDAVTRMR